jgi:hypothetical protein
MPGKDNYKAHVAIQPHTGLFTARELTQATGEDNHQAVVGLWLPDNDTEPGPFEVLRARSSDRRRPHSDRGPLGVSGTACLWLHTRMAALNPPPPDQPRPVPHRRRLRPCRRRRLDHDHNPVDPRTRERLITRRPRV